MYGQVTIRALLITTLLWALGPRAASAQPELPRAPAPAVDACGAAQLVGREASREVRNPLRVLRTFDPWGSRAPVWRPASAGPASPQVFTGRRLSLRTQGQPVEPAHAVPTAPPSAPAGEPPSLTQKWWFWAAVGALVVSTTVLLVVATREAEAPRTRLGNMEAFR
jgi:hypothetical protein